MPKEHRVTRETAAHYASQPEEVYDGTLADLNQLRIEDFMELARLAGFTVIHDQRTLDQEARGYLTPAIRQELNTYTEEELLLINQIVILHKPA